jgi:hypothetical protein
MLPSLPPLEVYDDDHAGFEGDEPARDPTQWYPSTPAEDPFLCAVQVELPKGAPHDIPGQLKASLAQGINAYQGPLFQDASGAMIRPRNSCFDCGNIFHTRAACDPSLLTFQMKQKMAPLIALIKQSRSQSQSGPSGSAGPSGRGRPRGQGRPGR